MRTLAIGDIHGSFRSLSALEAYVGFKPEDQIITLGDYVDRGPDSRAVIEWLMQRQAEGKLIALRGNHELMMLAARETPRHLDEWLASGGNAALASYNTGLLEEIPASHWQFMSQKLLPYHETKTHFFVHANVFPEAPLKNQPDFMLYWESFRDPAPHVSDKIMVCGHTPQRTGYPLSVGHAICIDTAACKGGWLTCLDVDAGYCWQANEAGETRKFWLDEID